MDAAGVQEKKRIALTSVVAGLALTGMKLIVGLATNSLGILSEAAHSGLDLLAALITYVAVSVSDKPADADHQYGHAKMENISALFETILLVATCGWIIWEGTERLIAGAPHVDATIWSYGVIGVSIVIDISRSRALSRVAKKYGSQALEADALHFSSDIWSSLTVLAGLVFVSFGYTSVDSVAALAVAVMVLAVSYRLGRRTIDALMDRVPPGLAQDLERRIRAVDGVQEVRSFRVRMTGSKAFVDATVGLRRTMPFERAHSVVDEIERAIRAVNPQADVTVHPEPMRTEDESIVDRVQMIVTGKGLPPPHNLEVHRSGDGYFIDFDVEYQKGRSFVEAHSQATEIEAQIRKEIPSVKKVTIHLEEYLADPGEPMQASDDERALCAAIEKLVLRDKRIVACTDISVLRHGTDYHVTLTCRMDSSRTLEEVHQIIAEAETKLYQVFGQVRRFTLHAEPIGPS
jgi:cation diffusion facilitator family transporter